MNFANYRDHAIPLFYDFKILPMSFLYFYNTACSMHVCDVHSYNTRAAARKNLYQPRARLNITSKSLSTMGVKIWNCLPLSIRNLSKSTFKKKCKRMLLEMLNTCDDYVDLAYIM
jgi:hypothetical protein